LSLAILEKMMSEEECVACRENVRAMMVGSIDTTIVRVGCQTCDKVCFIKDMFGYMTELGDIIVCGDCFKLLSSKINDVVMVIKWTL
jgi:hypothetical protein